MNSFITIALSINKTFYSNNPIEFELHNQAIVKNQVFSHFSLGQTIFTASEIFGADELSAVSVVQIITHNVIDRVTYLHGLLPRSKQEGPENKLYK